MLPGTENSSTVAEGTVASTELVTEFLKLSELTIALV